MTLANKLVYTLQNRCHHITGRLVSIFFVIRRIGNESNDKQSHRISEPGLRHIRTKTLRPYAVSLCVSALLQ